MRRLEPADFLDRGHFLRLHLCFQSYPELVQQAYQVVEELLLDNLIVLPVCHSAELELEFLVGSSDHASIRAHERAYVLACPSGHRTRIVAVAKEDIVWIVIETIDKYL